MTKPLLTYSPTRAGSAARTRDVELIERAGEIDALRAAVAEASAGHGALVVLEAPAGLGKTTLLDRAAAFAADAGCTVRAAAPGPREREFPFGVVRSLLEAPVRAGAPADGPAGIAARLLLDGGAPSADETAMIAHSAYWLLAGLAASRPLVLLVDDAQWADRASLEVLSYAGRRIRELPVVLVVASRPDD